MCTMEEIPQNIIDTAAKATENLLPAKSRAIYDREFDIFLIWKLKNAITSINETVMMAYFQELSEKFSPNSLWTKYSILKSTLMVNQNVDISQFIRLISFLKIKSKGYVPKKSRVLEGDQVLIFMKNAPNEIYLLHKVVLVMGVFGGLRRDEMVKMTIDDIEDKGSVLLVRVPETKTLASKSFTIVEEENIGALNLVRQFIALRPRGIKERRFFLTYRNNRCTGQPVGKNKIGSIPALIAKYLKLDNAKEYTGHCLRRTSSTLLVAAGATFETLKMHGKWKSSTVAEGYIEESISSKNKVAHMIASSVTGFEKVKENSLGSYQSQQVRKESLSSSAYEAENCSVTGKSNHSVVGSALFSGNFENCNFYFGKNI